MSFTTKVRKTGELFDATTDLGTDQKSYRDAHSPLDPQKIYAGHLFSGTAPLKARLVKYDEVSFAVFHGEELEEFFAAVTLVPFREPSKA
jgi:hypothetical protein